MNCARGSDNRVNLSVMGFEWDCAGCEYLIVKDNSDDGCSGAAVRECAVVPAAALPQARPVQACGQCGNKD